MAGVSLTQPCAYTALVRSPDRGDGIPVDHSPETGWLPHDPLFRVKGGPGGLLGPRACALEGDAVGYITAVGGRDCGGLEASWPVVV